MRYTNEGGRQFEHVLDHHVEFFSKAGSAFESRRNFYGNAESALSLFQKAWIVDKELAFKLLLWLRDCRGGAGNRSGFRSCLKWLADQDPQWVEANIGWIPEVGRWDDMRSLFRTKLEIAAASYWATALLEKDVLAAKWADRKDWQLRDRLSTSERGLRKMLSSIRKQHIVETKMCDKEYNGIDYEKVPSVAMSRYTQAFRKNDEERFSLFKDQLKSGEAKVHASVLFPHDLVRTAKYGDQAIANAQFDELPNYMEGTDERVIVISDTSGSMDMTVAGSIEAIDVSQGLALYCSEKIGEDNPFYRKFIGFCSEGKFKDWNGMTFAQAVRSRSIFDHAVGSTRIDKALDLILKTAKFFNLEGSKMPTMLLIVSDMQFHSGGCSTSDTEVNAALSRWVKAGYSKPKIVYWNTSSYGGAPETVNADNTALVSGFSPSILKAIFDGTDLTPRGVMLRALEKYTIKTPA